MFTRPFSILRSSRRMSDRVLFREGPYKAYLIEFRQKASSSNTNSCTEFAAFWRCGYLSVSVGVVSNAGAHVASIANVSAIVAFGELVLRCTY